MAINSTEEHRKLAYSPIGMGLENTVGWGTLTFTVSQACNQHCYGCWTKVKQAIIQKQLKTGTKWLYDWRYGINVLDSILEYFKEKGGKLVDCMSDGEPFVPVNYDFIHELVKSCGTKDLPFLLFTNGTLLAKEKLNELEKAAKGKISYCVSIQTGIRDRYYLFVEQGPKVELERRIEKGKMHFDSLTFNLPALQEYNAKVLKETGKHGVAIHTFISKKTTEEDMESVKCIVKELGNVPWLVTYMGLRVADSLKGKVAKKSQKVAELIKKHNTGPTATQIYGDSDNEKECAYINHGFYPFKKPKGVWGMTFNPWYMGAVQTCPYHSELSTIGWFNLKDYMDTLNEHNITITKKHIGKWLDSATTIEKMITQAAFDTAGYEFCLMRHSNKPTIDRFIKNINSKMKKRVRMDGLNAVDSGYFKRITKILKETIKAK